MNFPRYFKSTHNRVIRFNNETDFGIWIDTDAVSKFYTVKIALWDLNFMTAITPEEAANILGEK